MIPIRQLQTLLIGMSMFGLVSCNEGGKSATVNIGAVQVSTLKVPDGVSPESAAFTPSGKLVLTYSDSTGGRGIVQLATLNVDGSGWRPFFSGTVPSVPNGHGVNYLLFVDGKRIYMGDYVLECTKVFEACDDAHIVPIKYPDPLDSGPLLTYHASESVIAPDNKTAAWTAVLSDYSAIVLTGTLKREADRYVLVGNHIISTVEPFKPDPIHPGGSIPAEPVINGEVKQFVHGGAGISAVGAKELATADSVVLRLDTGGVDQITYTPGYDETTIFSPDERLGMVMTTRFSPTTDLAILGLMPRPHSVSLNMSLARYMYAHGVTGVRRAREGNIGPALVDIVRSEREPGYLGVNLSTDADWVFRSPMEWAPNSKMAVWPEGSRSTGKTRIQIVKLPDYQPGKAIATVDTPVMPGSTTDLTAAERYIDTQADIDVMVYGKHAGYVTYKLVKSGLTTSSIEKRYFDYSDDGDAVFNGSETMDADVLGNSVYTADVTLTGSKPGVMKLKATFGPLAGSGVVPARLIFDNDSSGVPQTGGFVQYNGQRLTFDGLVGN